MNELWRPLILVVIASCLFLSCRSTRTPNTNGAPSPAPSIANNSIFKVTSPVFNDGGAIPRKYTCEGENLSPPLEWSGIPSGTKSFGLILDDPDAPGKTWVHWVVYDLPPDLTALSENVASNIELAGTARQGTNDFKVIGYGGPCPPSGTHRYYFKLYALDKKSSFINPGETKDAVLKDMNGHILAESQLMGTYKR